VLEIPEAEEVVHKVAQVIYSMTSKVEGVALEPTEMALRAQWLACPQYMEVREELVVVDPEEPPTDPAE